MPVFDQYEVEYSSTYSGSFSDQVMFGNLFVNAKTLVTGYTPIGDPNPQTSRRLITSRVAGRGTTSPNINNMWMPSFLFEGYSSGSFLGRAQRFKSIFSDEYWLDSYMPNPVDIYLENGGTLLGMWDQKIGGPTSNELSGSAFGVYPFINLSGSPGQVNMAMFFDDRRLTGASDGQDEIWRYSFPFASRYKKIQKIFKFSTILPKSYNITQELFPPGPPPVFNSQSNTIGIIRVRALTPANVVQLKNFCGFMAYPNNPYPHGFGKVGTVNSDTFYNVFFSIGQGSNAKNGFESGVQVASKQVGFIFGFVKPRGYKYGIRSVAPEQTKCVYRLGRYGQLRDTLEGRPTVATYVADTVNDITNAKIKRTFFYPIELNFVSGSKIYADAIDYVTATNPGYNPYDSGIYDKYYRSGQPYFDRENED